MGAMWRILFVSLTVVALGCASGPSADDEAPDVSEKEVKVNPTTIDEAFDIQGHRGARGLRPESTLPSIEIALDLLVDTVELDLHLSNDDELIVWHDPFIEARKCHVPKGEDLPDPEQLVEGHQDLWIRNLSAHELSRYRCDRNPDRERFPDQTAAPTELAADDYRIITLEEALDFVELYAASSVKTDAQRTNAQRVRFNLETKREPRIPEFIGDGFDGIQPSTFEERLVAVIDERELQQRAMMQSFDHRSLWAARSLAPWLKIAVLDREIETPFGIFRDQGAAIWSPRARLVSAETVADARQAGLRIIPWTVNDPVEMARLIELGVDGIITDRPDLLVELRRPGLER